MARAAPGEDPAAVVEDAMDLRSRDDGEVFVGQAGRRSGGYNPHKPGRPSHCYHSALMANTRLALTVEVMAGNETAPLHQMPGIWA